MHGALLPVEHLTFLNCKLQAMLGKVFLMEQGARIFMFYNLRTKLKKRRFAYQARKILKTKPLKPVKAPLAIVSNLRHDDLLMYLVAIKSLYHRLQKGSITVINDGTLTEDDKALLKAQLGEVNILEGRSIDTGSCPDYIAWRGLKTIIDLSRDHYVIKLDSDVVVLDDLPLVMKCIEDNRSFVLGSFDCEEVWSAAYAADHAQGYQSDHTQILAERSLAHLPIRISFAISGDVRVLPECSGDFMIGLMWKDFPAMLNAMWMLVPGANGDQSR
ncbi:hypothetical protein JCM17846_25240 [Iodidimonas nitroreducens]|uniref:Uncharacterized protein n=2 Tax=Iodidimonas nitroreducens TaxID=1236968 RepID=A0A5A7N915_9PROT|nr:hypothetical protein JCM17846_25240 [Iodidimonas nitroreducens]